MPRLNASERTKHDKERGAAGVLVAVMMLVLIGAGAIAVDMGQIYAERAQLQNAADAGAMAAAQQCHRAGACTESQAKAWAAELSGANSNDGATTVDSVDLSVPNQVTVVTSTLNGGAGFLTNLFAGALNAPLVKVRAGATAAFSPPGGATAFPLAFSDCAYDLSGAMVSGAVQLIQYKPGRGSCTSTSGHVIPGGFGWLDQNSGTCKAKTNASGNADSDPGADYAAECNPILTSWKNTILAGGTAEATFPVYDNAGGTGKNGWLHIRGYATFNMLGWKFSGNGDPEVFRADTCDKNCRGIIGQFVRFESIDSLTGAGGTGANLGTVDIKLIK